MNAYEFCLDKISERMIYGSTKIEIGSTRIFRARKTSAAQMEMGESTKGMLDFSFTTIRTNRQIVYLISSNCDISRFALVEMGTWCEEKSGSTSSIGINESSPKSNSMLAHYLECGSINTCESGNRILHVGAGPIFSGVLVGGSDMTVEEGVKGSVVHPLLPSMHYQAIHT